MVCRGPLPNPCDTCAVVKNKRDSEHCLASTTNGWSPWHLPEGSRCPLLLALAKGRAAQLTAETHVIVLRGQAVGSETEMQHPCTVVTCVGCVVLPSPAGLLRKRFQRFLSGVLLGKRLAMRVLRRQQLTTDLAKQGQGAACAKCSLCVPSACVCVFYHC